MRPKHIFGYLVCALGSLTAICSLPVFALSAQRYSFGYAAVSDSCQNGALWGGFGFMLVALGIVSLGFSALRESLSYEVQRVPFGILGIAVVLLVFAPAYTGQNRALECVWGN
jgi:hypothetical protein